MGQGGFDRAMIEDAPDRRDLTAPLLFAAAGGLLAAHAALWLYFRARQDRTDDATRDRLRPRG